MCETASGLRWWDVVGRIPPGGKFTTVYTVYIFFTFQISKLLSMLLMKSYGLGMGWLGADYGLAINCLLVGYWLSLGWLFAGYQQAMGW